jgi:dipeptidyl aminopeptidase/acylaminoacyl peptidase
MLLTRLFLQMGTFLDYYTGKQAPSFSQQLRAAHDETQQQQGEASSEESQTRIEAVAQQFIQDEGLLALFPQFSISKAWPRTVLLHGTADTAVPVEESRHLARLLRASEVEVTLIEVEGEEHSFDLVGNAEERYGDLFNQIVQVLHGRHI